MPDIDIGLLSPTAAQANDAMVVRRGVDPTETVALVAVADFATAAQGVLADSAVQPGDLATVATSGSASDLTTGTLPVARIADASLALTKLANLATSTILGRATAGTGAPEALSAAQVRTIINVADGATANATDAFLLARANHTGTQAASTITGLAAIATSGSASDLSAGTLPAARFDDTAHGSRGGGTLHANATTSVAGFMSDADKLKLDGIASGAQVNVPTDLSYTASTRVLASSTGADATLPLFTSADAGLVPASGGGTTNFLRADGTWAAAGGGSTTVTAAPAADQNDWNPSGFGSSVGMIVAQPTTNSFISGIAAGATNQTLLLVNDSSFLICLERESTGSSAANRFRERGMGSVWILPGMSVSLRYDGTLARWAVTGQSRDIYDVGPRTQLFLPNSSTTVNNVGLFALATTATVSTNNSATSPGNDFDEANNFQVLNASASGTSSVRAATVNYRRGSVTGRQGFFHTGRVRFAALGATGAVRAGMASTSAVITTQNSGTSDFLALGADGGQTSLRIWWGGTPGTPIDLGANFPVPDTTAAYEYAFLALPNVSAVEYMVRRLDSRFVAQGTLTSNLPANTLALGQRIEVIVGATAVNNIVRANYLLTQGL